MSTQSEMIKLLIVDDEPLARYRIKSFNLAEHGFEIAGEAENGCEALDLLKSKRVDIMIVDIAMPVMGGLELLEEIQQLHNPPAVILLTCYEDFEKAQKCLRLGAEDYIVKTLLKEEKFIQALAKTAAKIKKDRFSYRGNISKILTEMIIHSDFENWKQCKEQLLEFNFNPGRYCVTVFDNADKIIHETSFQKDKGQIQFIDVNLTFRQKLILFYSFERIDNDKIKTDINSFYNDILQQYREGSSEFWIVIGNIYNDIEKIDQAWEEIQFLLKKLFYTEKGTIINPVKQEQEQDYFQNFPSEIFQKIVDRIRWFLSTDNSIQAACSYLTWLDNIKKYRPLSHEVKTMGLLLAICIPDNITIPYRGNNCYLLSAWFKEYIEKSYNISDVEKAIQTVVERLKIGYKGKNGSMREEIKKAIGYINNHYDQDLKLAQVAKHVNLSSSWFGSLFRSEVGETFHDYLTNLRIKMAQYLLIKTNKLVYEVAEQVGICDSHYFSRLFTSKTGCSPTEYRNKNMQLKA